MNQSVLKLTVSTTETVYRPPVQRDYPILGAYVPQCDDNGQYTSLQVGVCNLFRDIFTSVTVKLEMHEFITVTAVVALVSRFQWTLLVRGRKGAGGRAGTRTSPGTNAPETVTDQVRFPGNALPLDLGLGCFAVQTYQIRSNFREIPSSMSISYLV